MPHEPGGAAVGTDPEDTNQWSGKARDRDDPKRFRLLATLLGGALFFGIIGALTLPVFLEEEDDPGTNGVDAERVYRWADAIHGALEQYRYEHAGTLTRIGDGPIDPHLDLLGLDRRVFRADFIRADGSRLATFRLDNVRAAAGEWTLVVRSESLGVAFRQARGGTRDPLDADE